jgi:hypothetical protein
VTGPRTDRDLAGREPADGTPVVDVGAILTAMQDQIDDLTAAVEAQQRTIDELVRVQRATRLRPPGAPGAGR